MTRLSLTPQAQQKNAEKKRDPEMHQTKKGNQWYFGEKIHAGADTGTGYIHTMEVTVAANAADISVAAELIREDDKVVYADAAYQGIETRQEIKENPEFTDEECITTYLFGIAEGKFSVREIYDFIKAYWPDWFPKMPCYQNYNRRITLLAELFQTLYGLHVSQNGTGSEILSHLIDSMPVIVANNKRSGSAKVASELCDKGYCTSKGMYYYGVKLHILGQKQYQTLPNVRTALVTSASENDLTVAKEWLAETHNLDLFADKAYASEP